MTSFSQEEIDIIHFVLETAIRGGDVSIVTHHKEFRDLRRKVEGLVTKSSTEEPIRESSDLSYFMLSGEAKKRLNRFSHETIRESPLSASYTLKNWPVEEREALQSLHNQDHTGSGPILGHLPFTMRN